MGIASVIGTLVTQASAERLPFSLVVLPDTQGYTHRYPDVLRAQTRWIRDNVESKQIAFVLHEGDITNNNLDEEWRLVDECFSELDGLVPYTLCVGNHDVPNHGREPHQTRDTTKINEYFPTTRFEGTDWYRGHYGTSNDNHFCTFEAGGLEFLIVTLQFGPGDDVLEWANGVIADHPDRRTIVLTHCYMYFDDTRVGPGDQWSAKGFGGDGNDGEDIWEKLVRRHENIFLVLSGHILGDGLGRQTSTGDHGNPVHEMLANYQMLEESGGNGWLRVLTFRPDDGTILVRTYSPWVDASLSDSQNEFDLTYDMSR